MMDERDGNVGNHGDLPKGWAWTQLENCVDILDGKRVPINADEREKRNAGKRESELFPYFGATGQVGWINDFLFDEELLLLGEDGAPFLEPTKHKAYIIKGKTWVNNHAHVLRARTGLTGNKFLCHYLNLFDYHGYVTGTTRLKLPQAPLRKIPIPIAPLAEQNRTVAKIEELFSDLDAGVTALQKVKAQLKRYRQAVLKAAVEGRLTAEWRAANAGKIEPASALLQRIRAERAKSANGKTKPLLAVNVSELPELPKGWEWCAAWELCELITNGDTPASEKMTLNAGEIPYIKIYNLTKSGRLDFTVKPTFISVDTHNQLARSHIFPGDILMNIVGPPLGKVSIVPDLYPEWNTNQAVTIFRPFAEYDGKFLMFCLLTDQILRRITSKAKATAGQFNISLTMCRTLPLPVPPFAEQQQIVAEIERRLSIADEIEKTVDQSLKQAERLRQSILKRAFAGKLVPQDPNDEPAEKLLERIRSTRQTTTKIRQTKMFQ